MSEVEWMRIFGDNLKEILEERGMTQRDLADETGLSESAISNYINKKRMADVRAVLNIWYALGCPIDDIFDFGDMLY